MLMPPKALTVSEINNKIKNLLEGQFMSLAVQGEVSNLSKSYAGHWYFTLSDENASISMALFKMDALRNPHLKTLKEGDKIVCFGKIGVYSKRGTYQLIVQQLVPLGKGDLKALYLELLNRLKEEGLFDESLKKEIPRTIHKLAVITATDGAALQDFLNIYKRRSWWMDIVIVGSLVQGESAPKSLIKALKMAQKIKDVDCIVITRGGGSLEDLWAFNDEALAREIFKCSIPIISAVGHQVDFTICDFVSDLRCETPSAAAEVLTEAQTDYATTLNNLGISLKQLVTAKLQEANLCLYEYSPQNILDKLWQLFYSQRRKLEQLGLKNRGMELLAINEKYFLLDDICRNIDNIMKRKMELASIQVERKFQELKLLSPKNVLNRGFAYVQTSQGKILKDYKSFKKLSKGSEVEIHFKDGTGSAEKK